MVQRYILAFIFSAALMWLWVKQQPRPPENGGEADKTEVDAGENKPGGKKSDLPELEPAQPGESPKEQPEQSEEPEEPAEPEKPASTSAGIEVKGGRILKDGKELDGSAGAADLSIEGNPVNFAAEDKAPEKHVWKDEGKAGGYTITRVITDKDASADGFEQLSVKLTFKKDGNKPAEEKLEEARRYRIRGPSFSAQGDRVVVASRVDGEVKSWAFDQAPPKQEGDTEWVALRQSDRLAILSAEEVEDKTELVVDAKGIALESGLADGDSEVSYQLTFGSSAPAELIKFNDHGIDGELSRINRTEEDLVPGRFRLAVDSIRGGIDGVTLLDSWTAVEEANDREEQPLLLEQMEGRILLEMGSSSGKAEDDKDEGWNGRWSEKIVERDDQSREIIFEKTVEFDGKKIEVRKKISPASAGDFDKLLGDSPKYADGRLLHVTIELTSDKTIRSFPFRLYGPCAIASTSGRWVGLDMQFAYGTNYSKKPGAETHIYDPDDIPNVGGNKEDVAWLATVNSYFTALMFPREENPLDEGIEGLYADRIAYPVGAVKDEKLKKSLEERKSLQTAFKCNPRLPAKKTQTLEFGLYLGPRFSDFIKEGGQLSLDGANDLGLTSGLIKFFMGILHLLHGITGNWGAAIILLTVLVKICLHPITRKNQRGMMRMGKVMGKIKPEMDALQEKYGSDRMKYSQEVQGLWKKHNVNPAKQMLGCLVIFLQMPIWIGIIYSLDYTIELRQTGFLWIQDLTRPDMLDRWWDAQSTIGFLDFWPFYGHLNILPILYVILTLVNQSYMQPKAKEPQQAAQQKMMKFMMLFFGFIFYSFPAGFMLYIMTSAALGIAESKIIKAQLAKEDIEAEGTAAVSDPQEPLYPAKNKSAGQRGAPTSAKKKKNRRRKH